MWHYDWYAMYKKCVIWRVNCVLNMLFYEKKAWDNHDFPRLKCRLACCRRNFPRVTRVMCDTSPQFAMVVWQHWPTCLQVRSTRLATLQTRVKARSTRRATCLTCVKARSTRRATCLTCVKARSTRRATCLTCVKARSTRRATCLTCVKARSTRRATCLTCVKAHSTRLTKRPTHTKTCIYTYMDDTQSWVLTYSSYQFCWKFWRVNMCVFDIVVFVMLHLCLVIEENNYTYSK